MWKEVEEMIHIMSPDLFEPKQTLFHPHAKL
jgi:hypothetical protein